MAELVAHDVGALAGKDRASGGRTMEELQSLAVIKRVQVDAEIEVHGQDRAHYPRYPRHQCPPEIGCAPRSVETARALRPPRRAADLFEARLDRFLAMASLRCYIVDVELAVC